MALYLKATRGYHEVESPVPSTVVLNWKPADFWAALRLHVKFNHASLSSWPWPQLSFSTDWIVTSSPNIKKMQNAKVAMFTKILHHIYLRIFKVI